MIPENNSSKWILLEICKEIIGSKKYLHHVHSMWKRRRREEESFDQIHSTNIDMDEQMRIGYEEDNDLVNT